MGALDILAYSVRIARQSDISAIKQVADKHRKEFGFVPWAILEDQIRRGEIFVIEEDHKVVGFITFHHRRDGWTTIREVCVLEEHRRKGSGRALIQQVEQSARQANQRGIRLKCPIDLPANGFYERLGFTRLTTIEQGKRRPLIIWAKEINDLSPSPPKLPTFFLTLSGRAYEINQLYRLWREGGDPRDPFAHIIFTPLFSKDSTISYIRQLKEDLGSTIMFDSGGYQVQMGKISYEELFEQLLRFYQQNLWADWYVLPDYVPTSTDNETQVEYKVRDTIDFARLFLQKMPPEFVKKAIGVVHGRTKAQIYRCVEAYVNMGLKYIGFGSFGTSGPKGSINLISRQSLELLRYTHELASEFGLNLHIFGIGSPVPLKRLIEARILPTSFDSAGWWKAGGYGNVFFPGGRQLHINAAPYYEATLAGLAEQKARTNHECAFCKDLPSLRRNRLNRILHNLAVMLDTLKQLEKDIV